MAAQFPSFESRTITIDGVNLHYVCGGSGPPLVLVHGLGSSAAVEFYYNLEPLAAHHRVLAIDLPGFGKSDKPVLKYTIDLFVKAVRDLMLRGAARALRQMNPATIRRFWGWYLRRPSRMETTWSDERIANHGTLLSSPEYRAAYLSALRSIAGMTQLRGGVGVEDRLSELRMPTLLIWGRHDHIFPASHAESAKDKLPRGKVVIFDD